MVCEYKIFFNDFLVFNDSSIMNSADILSTGRDVFKIEKPMLPQLTVKSFTHISCILEGGIIIPSMSGQARN